MEQKLDKLLQYIDSLKNSQWRSQEDIATKFDRLEQDVAAGQEETLQLVAKKLKRDPANYKFRWKGNEKQFAFNEMVNDAIQSATSQLEKVKPVTAQDIAALKSAKELLQQGTKAIAKRQKHIRLADRSDYGWQLVEAYQQDELAENEKDAKKIEEEEKAVELKNRRKCKASDKEKAAVPQKSTSFRPPQFMGSFGLPLPPPFMPPSFQWPAVRVLGPCFHCLQMGHLKAHCPNKISKQYPFNNVLMSSVSNVHASVNGYGDKVCSGLLCVDKPQSDQLSKADHSKASGEGVQLDTYAEDAQQGPSVHNTGTNDPGHIVSGIDGPETTELQRYWELEQSETQILDVQGRLKNQLSFWKEVLQAPVPIIEHISEGYKQPLLSPPPTYSGSSAHHNADFVSSAIVELLQNRCVRKISYRSHICSPLSVVSNGAGKLKLVVNLRYLNQFLLKEKFKYEDLRVAMFMFQPDDYMFTFDLKSGYHHIDIHKEHWKYLDFAWGEGSSLQHYVFVYSPSALLLHATCFLSYCNLWLSTGGCKGYRLWYI